MSNSFETQDLDDDNEEIENSHSPIDKIMEAEKTTTTSRKSPCLSSFAMEGSYSSDEEEKEENYRFLRHSKYTWNRRSKPNPLPDLRFEQSYRNSIADAKTVGNIILITIRDQVILPLLQGTVWSLALLGWAHWSRAVQVSGNSTGTKIKRWWHKANYWKLKSLRDNGGSAELAVSVGDSYNIQNQCQ
ncbi:putative duf1770 domain-containing protein [Erysiphe necator]|uniref:Putative duf1770 domain-containing protein n=1 Tax=Uncinula necator TaxID=52586 RepID=A0A0B1P3B8_UNCNE|nr:putative duf1770 domain-containing protein [Erysiphe necator]